MDRFDTLLGDLGPERRQVLEHPLYAAVNDAIALRLFMASHAFAVWDFMSLLKALQQRLCCVSVPWLPPRDTGAARLINEIVLGEETDEVSPGRFLSHYELYLLAMQEVDADANLVREFVDSLQTGFPFKRVMEGLPILASTRRFTEGTLALCERGDRVELAAAFLVGREDLVPQMFQRLLAVLRGAGLHCPHFQLYLERHIHVDGSTHGPMARQLLLRLCGEDEGHWATATAAARHALQARKALWDGLEELIRHRTAASSLSAG
jgi:Protein of unknown function (DUF3050)